MMLATLPIYLIITTEFIDYGVVVAASPLFEMGTVFFIGAVVDRYGRKMVLLLWLFSAALLLFFLSLTKDMLVIFDRFGRVGILLFMLGSAIASYVL